MEYTHATSSRYRILHILIMLFIIAALGAGAAFMVTSTQKNARDAVRLAQMKEMFYGLELYFLNHNEYPKGKNIVGGKEGTCLDDTGFHPVGDCKGKIYMPFITETPAGKVAPAEYASIDGPPSSYRIFFTLESAFAGLKAGSHTMTPSGVE